MLLCDAAQTVDGKLFILGGGWTVSTPQPGQPVTMAVAIVVRVPWDRTNRPLKMTIDLRTEDGAAVTAPDGLEVRGEGGLEVGRPPGSKPGAEFNVPLAVTFSLPLADGGYAWVLSLDDSETGRLPFSVASKST